MEKIKRKRGRPPKSSYPPLYPIIEVPVEQLIEYAKCSLRHLYKYVYKVEAQEVDKVATQIKCLRETLLWFYGKLAARKEEVTLKEMFDDFDNRIAVEALLSGCEIDEFAELIAIARITLGNHFERSGRRGVVILGTNVPYKRTLHRNGIDIVVRGTIDLIKIKKDYIPKERTFELINFMTQKHIPPAIERANSIELVLSQLGLLTYEHFAKKKPAKTVAIWHSIHQDAEIEVAVGEHELRIATAWIANIALAVHNKYYYPQYEWTRCLQCPFRKGCNPDLVSTEKMKTPDQIREEIAKKLEQ